MREILHVYETAINRTYWCQRVLDQLHAGSCDGFEKAILQQEIPC